MSERYLLLSLQKTNTVTARTTAFPQFGGQFATMRDGQLRGAQTDVNREDLEAVKRFALDFCKHDAL